MRVLGITGGSGSGKSTLLGAVATLLGKESTSILRQDDYYRDLAHLEPEARATRNFDHPDAIEFDLLAAHVRALEDGRAIPRPVYDMTTHTRTPKPIRVEPREVVLIEGTLIGAYPGLRALLDGMVFVDLEDSVRLARRIERDTRERGRTEESVRIQWSTSVAVMFSEFVEPERTRADLVVRGDEPPMELAGVVLARLLR